jgi:WD40 repeat protein
MSRHPKHVRKPSIVKVEVHPDARAVIAENIEHLHLHDAPTYTPLGPFDSVPPLPGNYIARPELERLVDHLLSQTSSIGLTAVQGMAGVGKTVMALALCNDPRVRQAFPDGIVWLTFGGQSTLTPEQRIKQVAEALNQRFLNYNEAAYRSLLREKAALIVLDDVWELATAETFLPPAGRCRLLFTSRNRDIAGPLGADSHEVGVLNSDQARTFLLRWSGRERVGPPYLPLEGILKECKGLVLALAMIGSRLHGQDDVEWFSVLDDLRNARLKHVGRRPSRYEHETLYASIDVSVNALDPADRGAYGQLAILLEDMSAPLILLQALWGGGSDRVRTLARRLVDRSLAAWDAQRSLRLHDLQLDYVRTQYSDQQALDTIHDAMRLSSAVIERDPPQFASQMVGRLLTYSNRPVVRQFAETLIGAAPRPWLRPLYPTLHPPDKVLVRTLSGHLSSVYGVAISPDERLAVSASEDKTLKIWDLETGRVVCTLIGHSASVSGVALSPDGRFAVSGCSDHTLKVWDLEACREIRTLVGHSGSVWDVAVTADGRRAVSASDDGTLKVWDLETGQEVLTLLGHSHRVNSVAASPDGRRAISASQDGTLKVWDLESGRETRTLVGHSGSVHGVAITPDGRRAVSSFGNHTMKVWDLETGQEVRTLVGHSRFAADLAISADGRRIVSASYDKTLKVWDLDTGREMRTLVGHSSWVSDVAISRDGHWAVSASCDNTLKVWSLEKDQEVHARTAHSETVTGVAVDKDGKRAVSASHDKTLKVWDLDSGEELCTLAGHSDWLNAVAVSANGRLAVSASDDQTLKVWDLETGRELHALVGHLDTVDTVAMSADGRCALSGSNERSWPRVWDVETGLELRALKGHRRGITGVAVTADGLNGLSVSRDSMLKIWELESGLEVRTIELQLDELSHAAISADGGRAVFSFNSNDDHTIRVWDLINRRELHTLAGHSSWINGVTISADGLRAISASQDQSVRVWDLETGTLIATFTCDAQAQCCAFAGNHTIVAGDNSGQVHFLALKLGNDS